MNTIFLFVLIYLLYIVTWFVINLVAYFISTAFKKPVILSTIIGLAVIVVYIFNFIIGISLLIFTVLLLFSGQFLLFLLFIFFGIGLISGLLGLLQLPITFIPAYFAEKVERMDLAENVAKGEILDKDNKVVSVTEGDTAVSIRLAKYFLAFYALNLASLVVFPTEREGLYLIDYILKPFFQIVSTTIIIGALYSIYRKLKYKKVFPKDKRIFIIQVWKISLYIFIPVFLLLFTLALMTNTL